MSLPSFTQLKDLRLFAFLTNSALCTAVTAGLNLKRTASTIRTVMIQIQVGRGSTDVNDCHLENSEKASERIERAELIGIQIF